MKKSKISDLSLRTKIFVFTLMPFFLVIIMISILSIQHRIKNERELTSNRIESYVTLLESGDLSFNSIKQKEKIEKLLNEKVLSAELIKSDRSITFATGDPEYEISKEQIDKAFQGYIITFTIQNKIPVQISLHPIIVKNTVVGLLHLELSFEKSNYRIRQYTLFILFLNILGIILSFLLIYFLSKKIILNRLKSLTYMCSEIRGGNLNYRLSVKSHDELGRLALTFNDTTEELVERNQQLKEEKQKVLDNIRELEKQVAMRKQAEEELKKHRDHLEELVKERTIELKTAQEELIRKEQLAILGQFSGSISHELRNPLAVIDSSIYYLKMKLKESDETIHKHLGRIGSSVNSSTTIIDSLLSITRMKKPEMRRNNLISLVSDSITNTKIPVKVKVIQDFPDKEISVNIEYEQCRIALKNIIRNACEAMDNDGTLTVTIRKAKGKKAEISFKDTGYGIVPENIDKIFLPLFSTKARGIGFGLSISKMIIENHRGTLRVKSESGKGADFIICLPLL